MAESTWQDAIEHVVAVAEQDSCDVAELIAGLQEISTAFEAERNAALAYIAETAAKSCVDAQFEHASLRLAIADLCCRMMVSMESNQPFQFTGADPVLLAILFPETTSAQTQPAAPAPIEAAATESVDDAPPGMELCNCVDELLLKEFLNEAHEHMHNAEQLLLNLESNATDSDSINGLFRAVHSLKGSAGVLELKALGAVTHLAESVLVRVREGQLKLSGNVFEAILIATDFITEQVNSLNSCHQAKRPIECPRPSPKLLSVLTKINENGRCSDQEIQELRSQPRSEDKSQKNTTTVNSQSDTLRVDGKRLEQLIDLIGELVITEAMVQRELTARENLSAASVSSRLRKVVREVQQLSLTLKMVPIASVFQKMNRLIRDVSAKLGKQVELAIDGADTEVDKTLLECIADPLVHLIRNSLDHGIESSAAERIAAGKTPTATIRLSAEHRAGNIHIRVSDDGRGLNREKILARAIQRGLISENSKLADTEIDQLIFEPGFSTAETVTDISGRGVGMDVVRRNVEAMRGTITLMSTPGQGTEILLELPLTLSIIDGTVLRTGERFFIVPTLSVIEQVQAEALEYSGNVDCRLVRFRDRFLSVRKLGDVLGTPHAPSLKHGQVCIVVECSGKHHALIVDEVLGQQPVVIKPLGGVLAGVDFFAGGALLSDGDVGFVLDLNAVCRQ